MIELILEELNIVSILKIFFLGFFCIYFLSIIKNNFLYNNSNIYLMSTLHLFCLFVYFVLFNYQSVDSINHYFNAVNENHPTYFIAKLTYKSSSNLVCFPLFLTLIITTIIIIININGINWPIPDDDISLLNLL